LVIVVDSSVWINKFRGIQTEAVRTLSELDDDASILVGDIILLELLQGARTDAQARRIERLMRAFAFERMLDRELSVVAARNFRTLRGLGFTIRTSVDLIIATFCIEHGHALLQDDRDFLPMARHLGLRLA
jgi:predicted nucleic acid-binding protein